MSVTLLHLFDTLMNRQVDRTGAAFLRRAVIMGAPLPPHFQDTR